MNKVYLLSVIKALELYSEKGIMHFAEAAKTQPSTEVDIYIIALQLQQCDHTHTPVSYTHLRAHETA